MFYKVNFNFYKGIKNTNIKPLFIVFYLLGIMHWSIRIFFVISF